MNYNMCGQKQRQATSLLRHAEYRKVVQIVADVSRLDRDCRGVGDRKKRSYDFGKEFHKFAAKLDQQSGFEQHEDFAIR